MVLIECFTESHIDNIASCLHLCPEVMILVGDLTQMRKPIRQYRQVLRLRKQKTKIQACDVHKKDFTQIKNALAQLIAADGEYVIDMTGGDEPVIMAVGALIAGLDEKKRKQVCVQTFDHLNGLIYDNMNNNTRYPSEDVTLTVEQLLLLHGGKMHPDAYQPEAACQKNAVAELWQIVTEDPKNWNHLVSLLNEFESRAGFGMQISLQFDEIRDGISDFAGKIAELRPFLKNLQDHNVIRITPKSNALEYVYQSNLLRYCMLKAGNVLEVKTLLEGRDVNKNGKPLFCDNRMSVTMDWDGIVFDPEKKVAETRNEIDVVLMCGLTPLFISCKNGNVAEEELYKLNTVAARFGGPYAKKMLIATDFDRKSPASKRAFAQRAWDMDILLVPDGACLSSTEWRNIFKQAMQNTTSVPIEKMLSNAYIMLGVGDKKQLEQYVKEAQDYLQQDREHYIELSDEEAPATLEHGKICKLVPLAQRVEKTRYLEYTQESRLIFALMVAEDEQDYVYIQSSADLYKNPKENCYTYPHYIYADLQNPVEGLQVTSPKNIQSITTEFEWDCYCIVFAAYMKLCKQCEKNVIPHKTERAMLLYKNAKKETVHLGKKIVSGKLLPLAISDSFQHALHTDHRRSSRTELCLLTEGKEINYVLRTTHNDQYFEKVGGEDEYYKDTTQKQEIEYQIITWDEIPGDLSALYY